MRLNIYSAIKSWWTRLFGAKKLHFNYTESLNIWREAIEMQSNQIIKANITEQYLKKYGPNLNMAQLNTTIDLILAVIQEYETTKIVLRQNEKMCDSGVEL
ncbi:MAG: hypothetical protein QXL01_00350 [Thermoplasmatales archaeon]